MIIETYTLYIFMVVPRSGQREDSALSTSIFGGSHFIWYECGQTAQNKGSAVCLLGMAVYGMPYAIFDYLHLGPPIYNHIRTKTIVLLKNTHARSSSCWC